MIKVTDYYKTGNGYCLEYEVTRKQYYQDGSTSLFGDKGIIYLDKAFCIYTYAFYYQPLKQEEMRMLTKKNKLRLLTAPEGDKWTRGEA